MVSARRALSWRAAFGLCVITAVVTMGAIQMWPAGATGSPSRPIDRTINSYSLFALDSINVKGGNGATTNISGDVGVQSDDATDNIQLCGGGGSHAITMADGTQLNGGNINAGDACSFWDVYSNNLTGNPTIRNSGPTTFAPPIIPLADLPAFPSFSCNPGAPVTVPKGGSLALAPGTYGDLTVKDGATLTLAGGTYTFCSISNGQDTSIVDVDATIVQVVNTVNTNGGIVGPSANAHFYVRGDHTGSNQQAVGFGRGGTVAGTWWVPNSQMNLGNGTDLTGHFWAESLNSDFNIQVHGKAPCVDP